MRSIIVSIVCFLFLKASAQTEKFDGKNWKAPYFLEMPKGWDIERFLIPIEFAPSIPYKGVEDIRFTPGWSKKETDEYWSYAFLWYLDGPQTFDPPTISKNLRDYYTGLLNINVDKDKVAADKLAPTKVSIKTRMVEKGDVQTFEGNISMADFMTLQPIELNVIIHVRSCEGQNKTFVFHEVSPKPYGHEVWKSLSQLWTGFKCTQN